MWKKYSNQRCDNLAQLQGWWQDGERARKVYSVEGERVKVYNADSTNRTIPGSRDAVYWLEVFDGQVYWGVNRTFCLKIAERDIVEWVSQTSKKRNFFWYRRRDWEAPADPYAWQAQPGRSPANTWNGKGWLVQPNRYQKGKGKGKGGKAWLDAAWHANASEAILEYEDGNTEQWQAVEMEETESPEEYEGEKIEENQLEEEQENQPDDECKEPCASASTDLQSQSESVPDCHDRTLPMTAQWINGLDPNDTQKMTVAELASKVASTASPPPGLELLVSSTSPICISSSSFAQAADSESSSLPHVIPSSGKPPEGCEGANWIALREVVVRAEEALDSSILARLPEGTVITQNQPWRVMRVPGAVVVRMWIYHQSANHPLVRGFITLLGHEGNESVFFVALSMMFSVPAKWRLPLGCIGALWVAYRELEVCDGYGKKLAYILKGTQFWQLANWTKDNEGTIRMNILFEDEGRFVEGWIALTKEMLELAIIEACIALRSEPSLEGQAWLPPKFLQ